MANSSRLFCFQFLLENDSQKQIDRIVLKIKKIKLIKCIKVETITKIIYKIIINKNQ